MKKIKQTNKTTELKLVIGQVYRVSDAETTTAAYLVSYIPEVMYRFREVGEELDFEVYQTDLDTSTISIQA